MERDPEARDLEQAEAEVPAAAGDQDPAPAEIVFVRSADRKHPMKQESPASNRRARSAGRP